MRDSSLVSLKYIIYYVFIIIMNQSYLETLNIQSVSQMHIPDCGTVAICDGNINILDLH